LSYLARVAQRTSATASQPAAIGALIAGALAAAGCLLMVHYDATAGAVFPFALVVGYVMVRRPWILYAATLAQFSIFPAGGHFLGFFTPNLSQLFIPVLLLAVFADVVMRRRWDTFSIRTSDVFVALFIGVAIVGMIAAPGRQAWKVFVNQMAFPIVLYFATRWLDLDRTKFKVILTWVLIAAFVMVADMALVQLTGWGSLWGNRRDPFGGAADLAAYTALWPPLFLYMAASARGAKASSHRRWWLLATVIGVIATAGVTERSGIAAAVLGLLVCMLHPRMFKYVLIGIVVLVPIGAWWLSTSLGQHVHSRFVDDKDPMLRRRVYTGKAIEYIRSEKWNPVWGTGFWRLKNVSNEMLSETKLVWDANHESWRSQMELGRNPVHCAPLTIFGEFGYAGVFCLFGLLGCMLFSLACAYRRAKLQGAEWDSMLLVALLASAMGLLLNALFHNTEHCFQATLLCWVTAGLMVGHAGVFVTHKSEAADVAQEHGAVNR